MFAMAAPAYKTWRGQRMIELWVIAPGPRPSHTHETSFLAPGSTLICLSNYPSAPPPSSGSATELRPKQTDRLNAMKMPMSLIRTFKRLLRLDLSSNGATELCSTYILHSKEEITRKEKHKDKFFIFLLK